MGLLFKTGGIGGGEEETSKGRRGDGDSGVPTDPRTGGREGNKSHGLSQRRAHPEIRNSQKRPRARRGLEGGAQTVHFAVRDDKKVKTPLG